MKNQRGWTGGLGSDSLSTSVSTVKECVHHLDQEDDEEKLVSALWGAERCLRVLESVSVVNSENRNKPAAGPGLGPFSVVF